MALPTIFELCEPRDDVRRGAVQDTDFAADLAQVLRGDAPLDYTDAARFFANTHPTRGLKTLLRSVCARLSGSDEQVAAIFRLDTQFGGGKTHALIALAHAAQSMRDVPSAAEFVDLKLVPTGKVGVFGFEGENADPANGRKMGDDVRAYTPWGEMGYALGGREGYDLVRASDEQGVAPGADVLRELLAGGPKLLLLDELGIYLRKLKGKKQEAAGAQLAAFLSALFSAVETSKNAALVFTLAVGKGGVATDAYGLENQFVSDRMAELDSVSGRKATLLNPTEEDETPFVLRRRLFAKVDTARVNEVIEAYRSLWMAHQEALPGDALRPETTERLRTGYPLHPELLHVFTHKTSTLENFQRVRGMLRFLARTVKQLWDTRPAGTYAIHVHHIDPGVEAIKQEIVTRLGQEKLVPAISSDVAGTEQQPSLAQELDRENYKGLQPFGSFVGRNVLLHTLAFNDQLKGVQRPELLFSILAPGIEPSYALDAATRFQQNSSYLDDRTGAPLRFQYEANLNQLIKRTQGSVDANEIRTQLKDRIKEIFGKGVLEMIPFPGVPGDVPDGGGDGRPVLAVMGYEAVDVAAEVDDVPDLIERIFQFKGASQDLRRGRNNIVFLTAEQARVEEMKSKMGRRLALESLQRAETLTTLAEHQQLKIKEMFERSAQEVAVAIQQCYRHIFYPSRSRLSKATVDLQHAAIDVQSSSEKPGNGQTSVVRTLREASKLRVTGDAPDTPGYIRDRTPLKKGQISTAALREEFRRDPALPMLIGDDVFIDGIRRGVEQGEYIYKSGELLFGKGDPFATIKIDENSFVLTMQYAKDQGIWPRPAPEVKSGSPPKPGGDQPAGGGDPAPGPQPGAGGKEIIGEGVLKEALIQVWEQARKQQLGSIKKLSLQVFEGTDVFRLLGCVAGIPSAVKRVELEGSYVTLNDGEMTVHLSGPIDDAKPLKEFLDPHLRASADAGKSVNLEARYLVTFNDGLSMTGDVAEKFAERLTKLSIGSVQVRAAAEG